MNMTRALTFLLLIVILTACAPASPSAPEPASTPTEFFLPASASATPPPIASPLGTATLIPSPLPPTETLTLTPIPTVESLKAKVSADKIICRYGPGKNYLYLIAFNKNTPLRLIGRTEGKSDWVLVENGTQDCWVDSTLLAINDGASHAALPIVYPGIFKIPVSPYYAPTTVLTAERSGGEVTVKWAEVIVSPGKYENEFMFPYIVEIWFCKDGEIVFDTLGARVPQITFTDEAGCAIPSHGRVYIQEKHGFAGPAEIPWPGR
jgi:hypothetical protein